MPKIRILNPAHPGGSHTSVKQAERYVRRGVARWIGDALEFIESDHRHISVVASADLRDRIAARGYDDIGCMTLNQVQGLPVCGDAIKAFMIPSKRGNGYRSRP